MNHWLNSDESAVDLFLQATHLSHLIDLIKHNNGRILLLFTATELKLNVVVESHSQNMLKELTN